MTDDIFRVFASIVDALAASPYVDLQVARLEPGVTDPVAQAAALGLQLAEPVAAFYRQVGVFELVWYAKDAESPDQLSGEVCIHSLDEMLKVRTDPGYWDGMLGVEALHPDARPAMRSFFPLDYVRSDDQDAVGWIERDRRIEDGIALYTMRDGLGIPELTIAEYVNVIATTYGAIGEYPGRPAQDVAELASRVTALLARGE